MKKHLLLSLAVSMGGFAVAQTTSAVVKPKLNPTVANQALPYVKNQQLGASAQDSFESVVNNLQRRPTPQLKAFTTTTIGTTGYQLQTNASLCNRLHVNADGTIAATWTMSMVNDGTWADRGTGYNYYNGSAWGTAPTARLENVRVGWPSIGVTAGGKEIISSHEAANIHIADRATQGSGTWNNSSLGHPDVWPRMVVGGANGQTVHVISQTTGTANPPFMGQDGAVSYSRSLDGGVTWDKLRTVIPQIDVNSYLGFGGDSYSIDAKGDTVVIALGGFDVDVVLIKSVDNGETWTKTIVKYFPIPNYDGTSMVSDINGDLVADTIETNDASIHVVLDNQRNAHVFFGGMRVLGDGAGLSYFPFTDGLYYWNESMPANSSALIAVAQDIDNDQVLNVTAQGRYQVSMASMASAAVDGQGRIYVAYSSLFEGDAENGTPGDGKSYRHTYLLRSSDNGATWCGPMDVTDPDGLLGFMEGVWGSVARRVDSHVHLLQQIDPAPGHGIGANNDDASINNGVVADMVYTKVPVTDFDPLPCYPAVVVTGINQAPEFSANVNVYPNPATDVVNIVLSANEKANATVTIYNAVGQKVNEFSNYLNGAAQTLTINTANYQAGVYFVSVNINGKLTSKKVIVK